MLVASKFCTDYFKKKNDNPKYCIIPKQFKGSSKTV